MWKRSASHCERMKKAIGEKRDVTRNSLLGRGHAKLGGGRGKLKI